MVVYSGKAVYPGVAVGQVFIAMNNYSQVIKTDISDTSRELKRFEAAISAALIELDSLIDESCFIAAFEGSEIFEAQKMVLKDPEFEGAIKNFIENEEVNAEYAVSGICTKLSESLYSIDDEFTRARAIDVKDVSERVIRLLIKDDTEKAKDVISTSNDTEKLSFSDSKISYILLVDDITPSDFMKLDKSNLSGIIINRGTVNSHTSILARALGIPTIVGTKINIDALLEESGKDILAVVDAVKGEVILDPDDTAVSLAQKQIELIKKDADSAYAYKGQKAVTKDGKHIPICANIEGLQDLDRVIENDAEGIGLFRSEFLYLGREDYPSLDEQFEAYKTVLEAMDGKKVVIRTLDIGLDKKASYFNIKDEENPALGYRAIRISLDEPEIFKTQLKALLKASVYGDLSILYPMITSVWELEAIKQLLNEAADELREESVEFSIPKQGVMIETPAAVMISDLLAEKCDFLSIGTNDLTQYTLAIDRQNPRLERFYNPHHEAIMRMIKMTVSNAHQLGKKVSICGELASDTELTDIFVKAGIDELSVAPGMILPIRSVILNTK